MKFTSVICTASLSSLMLVGIPSWGQAATTANTDDAVATPSSQTPPPASGYSKVRIVRLSEVKGEVLLDRNTGRGFETPMANLPITEGAKLKTGDGVAEVEFEDNSTVRLAQNTLVEFPRLEMLPSGAKASGVTVLQGMVYVSLMNTKGNEFTVAFGKQKLNLPPDSHIRVQLSQEQAFVAVMHGDAQVEAAGNTTTVGKNKTVAFSLSGQGDPVIAKSVTEEPLDSWDHDAVQYHKSYANATSFGNSPYAYGINDMNYYGSFVNGGGCGGSMWRPYFTSASWDPFGSGAWAYYPSAGYSWVSPYPWGWTPYHYGSWAFCDGIGWGWRPGGNWMGLANNSFSSLPTRPHPPTRPPIAAQSSLVPVNLKAIPTSNLGAHDTFVFRKDSAGFGVPRGTLGKLNSYSGQTAQHGMASTNVYYGGQRNEAAGTGHSAQAPSASTRSSSSPSMQHSAAAGAGSSHSSAPSGGGAGRH